MYYKVGDKASIDKIVTEKDVILFSEVTLDNNPVHFDESFAEKTIFKKRIVHGMLGVGLISAAIGTKLPGIGSIYLEQKAKFLKPVYLNDRITAEVEIIEVIEERGIYILSTICKNQLNEIVITGEAKILRKEG